MIIPAEDSGFILASSLSPLPHRNRFSGVAYTDQAVIIGEQGYEQFSAATPHGMLDLHDGRFCIIRYEGNTVEARTDALGQEILYYYCQDGVWGISNSFLGLARFLVEQGVRLTLDHGTLKVPLITHSTTQQLLSNDTGIREIRVLPADRFIRLQLAMDHSFVRWELLPCGDLSNKGPVSRDDYVDTLTRFVVRSASRASALVRHFGDRARFDITGGQDSRLVLALLAASGTDLSGLNFLSNRRYEMDYAAAAGLGKTLGFQVRNKPVKLARTTPARSYELWKLGNLGVYYPVYIATGQSPQHAVHFHGACGECYRDYYGATAQTFIKNIQRQISDPSLAAAYAEKLSHAFVELDVDMAAPDSMMIHYRHFRSRFHFGRSAFRNLNSILITPLASSDLIHATRHLSVEARTDSQLALDLLLLACPTLATQPFDKSEKAFKPEAFLRSPFRNGAPDIRSMLSDLKVFCGPPPAMTPPATQGSFQDHLVADLLDKSDAACSTGLFTPKFATNAASKIVLGTRLTMDAKAAAHVITVGELATLLADKAASPPIERKLQVQAWRVGAKVKAHSTLAGQPQDSEVEFAFYLRANQQRQSVRWYSDLNNVTFELPRENQSDSLQVHGFARETGDSKNKISVIADVKALG